MNNDNDDDNIDTLLGELLSDADESEDEDNVDITFEEDEPDTLEIDSAEDRQNDYDEGSNTDIDGPDDPLECNKQLLSFWLQLKEHTTTLLQKVECKLTAIETRMKCRNFSNKQVLFYTPGIPYFKDRNHFSPYPNEDEIVKKSRGEIHIDMLPKVCPWTANDRSNLLKLIKQEAITTVLQSQENVNASISTAKEKRTKKSSNERKKNNSSLPSDFKEMVGVLGTREFDWSHIANTRFHNKHSALDCHVMWTVFLHPDINKIGWKKSEDAKLKEIARKYKYQDWDKICEQLATNRSAYQCFIRYNSTKKAPEIRNCVWPPDEDNRLCKLVEVFQIGDFIQWREIATFMDSRTKQQAYFRWTYSLSPDLTKGRFTSDENKILLEGIKKYGPNFRKISADLMPNRSAVQLNDHYQRLQPDGGKQRNTWTKELDNKLLLLHTRFGAKWSQIAQHFNGKSRTQLRHRHTALKKLMKKKSIRAVVNIEPQEFEDEDNTEQVEVNLSHTANETNADDVDIKLIEYFRTQNSCKKSESSKDSYDAEELDNYTENLYNILKLLNADLEIPDSLDDWPLNNRQKQLLLSLKEYYRLRNDKERHNKIIERCAKHMFASSSSTENQTDSISLKSSGVRKRKKKLKESNVIDYDLNRNCTFVIDPPTELETPDCVKNALKEDNITFVKLCRLLQSTNCSSSQRFIDKRRQIFSSNIRCTQYKTFNTTQSSEVQGNFVPNLFMVSKFCNEQTSTILPQVDKYPESINEPTAIEPTPESLLGLKNLLYMKNLSRWLTQNCGTLDLSLESNEDINEIMKNLKSTESPQENRNAYNLLERRITQLFQYPLGLSKTELPKVHNMCM